MLELVGLVPVREVRYEVLALLEQNPGQRFGGDLTHWYRWVWERKPGEHPDYADFKASLYEDLDPRFRESSASRASRSFASTKSGGGGVWRDGIRRSRTRR
ncbi:MAG: hypothetical protein IPO58_24165 [Betaproteobacteria bacterium]|nr:hypothetical protein [Betaproteobacteria bacterium]